MLTLLVLLPLRLSIFARVAGFSLSSGSEYHLLGKTGNFVDTKFSDLTFMFFLMRYTALTLLIIILGNIEIDSFILAYGYLKTYV